MRCVAEGVLLIFAALKVGCGQAAQEAPVDHKTNDLADVLLKAVELMDHGLTDFLKEQTAAPNTQDTQTLVATENKAINVIHQISTNFHDLKEVVGKFKKRHQNELKGVENKLVQQKEEDKQCFVDKANLQGRAEHCESVLQRLAPQGPGNETFSVMDWKDLDAKASARIKELQAENAELSGSVNELKTKAHDAERSKQDAETRAKQLEEEAASLRAQVAQLKNDETSMLKTMKTLVQKNKVKTMETQANSLKEARDGMQTEFEKKEQALKEKEAELQKQLEAAQADAAQKQKDNTLIKKQMGKIQTSFNVLNADKVHLLGSLNSVLRQNNEFQQQIKLFSSGGCALKNSTGLPVPGNLDAVAESTGSMIMADQTLKEAADSESKDEEKKDEVETNLQIKEVEVPTAPMTKGGSSLLQQSIHPHAYRAFTATAGDHHALNSWLSKPVEVLLQQQQVQTPRRNFLPKQQEDDDSDVLQQLALISTGWQNHRVKA